MTVCEEAADDLTTSAAPDGEGEHRAPSEPLAFDDAIETQIDRHWRRGTSLVVLARQYSLPARVVEQMIDRMRAVAVLAKKCELLYSPCFEARDADAAILGPMPERAHPASRPKPPAGLPPYLASLYIDGPVLDHQQERHLFRKMNYLKFRAVKLRESLEPLRARASDLDDIERLNAEALAVKN